MGVLDRSAAGLAFWIALFAAVASLALAGFWYLTPDSPIRGTSGALLAAAASLAVAIALFILRLTDGGHRGLFGTLSTLTLIGSLGIGLAGYMLMRPGIVIAMAVCFLAVLAFLLRPFRVTEARHAERL